MKYSFCCEFLLEIIEETERYFTEYHRQFFFILESLV